ncbi:MAG: diacylglycerol kinase family lipid kinase [Ruminococcaceae bacterium]|nr:diacylglycerol kinase family lipid kinase [Oscillospiraceae bacterium]
MPKKLLFIVNPRAGRTKSHGPLFDAAAIYSEAGYLLTIRNTRRRGDATRLVEQYGADYDLIVCHGGDGTLNETVNGLMRIPADRRPQVSYLPGGSTNDFAASLNISSDLAVAAQSAMRMRARMLDVGRFADRHFVYVASFGAFTRTSYSVPQDVKNVFGHFAYILEGVRDLDTLRPYRIRLTADGETFNDPDGYLFGAISNSTSIAGMMKLAPEDVQFDDGEFELLLVRVPKTPAQLQSLTRALLYAEYDDDQGLIFRHVRHVTAETEENIPWTLDGEFVPGAPRIDVSIEENGIQMLL